MVLNSSSEQRRFMRIPFKRSVKCKTTTLDVFSGHLGQDLSEGGLRVYSNDFIPVGTRMTVKIQLDARGNQLDLEGKVKWVKSVPYSENFQIGVEFIDGATFEKFKIAQFVYNLRNLSS